MDLEGQTVLVTGASRGIGRALVAELAKRPVRVLAGVRDLDGFEPIAAEHPGASVTSVLVDLGSREAIERSVEGLPNEIDVLVNNAGAFTAGLLETQELDDIYDVFQATLIGPVHLTRALLPAMLGRGHGKIVTNSSIVGYLHFPGVTTYSSAKAGVAGFAECLRRELDETPLTTLHVVTGGIDTDMLDQAKSDLEQHVSTDGWDQHTPEEWAEKIAAAIESDDETLGPGGKAALGKLATHMPSFVLDTVASRAFDREAASGQ